ncbi:MAG: extensin family protein [Candidatus Odyssella sp.]|nr:extensin family protein [Candidatus Odyssella sp.]
MPATKIATGLRPPLLAISIIAGLGAAGCSNLGAPLEGETPSRQVQSGRQTPAQSLAHAEADKQLLALGIVYRRLPDEDSDRGCVIENGVEVSRIGNVKLTRPALLTQDMAIRLGRWVKDSLEPEAQKTYRTQLAAIDVGGSYSCRNIYGKPFGGRFAGRLSEHAFANAIDIGGFKLADGRSVEYLHHWSGKDGAREFFLATSTSACEIFNTTLTPDYDRFHRNHIHIDASPKKEGDAKFCGIKGRFAPGSVPAFARYKVPGKKVKTTGKKQPAKKATSKKKRTA